jgi:hypothetical protein
MMSRLVMIAVAGALLLPLSARAQQGRGGSGGSSGRGRMMNSGTRFQPVTIARLSKELLGKIKLTAAQKDTLKTLDSTYADKEKALNEAAKIDPKLTANGVKKGGINPQAIAMYIDLQGWYIGDLRAILDNNQALTFEKNLDDFRKKQSGPRSGRSA